MNDNQNKMKVEFTKETLEAMEAFKGFVMRLERALHHLHVSGKVVCVHGSPVETPCILCRIKNNGI